MQDNNNAENNFATIHNN